MERSESMRWVCSGCGGDLASEFPARGASVTCPDCGTWQCLPNAQPGIPVPDSVPPVLSEPSHPPSMERGWIAVVGLLLVFGCVAVLMSNLGNWGESGKTQKVPVNAGAFDRDWPLEVKNGYILAIPDSSGRAKILFETVDGEQYGLNGAALAAGYADPSEIQKYEETEFGRRYKNLSGLIEVGLRLVDEVGE